MNAHLISSQHFKKCMKLRWFNKIKPSKMGKLRLFLLIFRNGCISWTYQSPFPSSHIVNVSGQAAHFAEMTFSSVLATLALPTDTSKRALKSITPPLRTSAWHFLFYPQLLITYTYGCWMRLDLKKTSVSNCKNTIPLICPLLQIANNWLM